MRASLCPGPSLVQQTVRGVPSSRKPAHQGCRRFSLSKNYQPVTTGKVRNLVVAGASTASNVATQGDPYLALEGREAWLVSEQRRLDVTELWGEDERCVFVFARSMGCFFCQELARQLERDIIPELDKVGVKLFLVSMGPPERGLEFSELTGFRPERLIADPDSTLYKSVGFYTGLITFFNPKTPLSLLQRVVKDGAKDLVEAFQTWKPWIPPRINQAYQEGGCLVFEGKECVLAYYEEGPGTHVDFEVLLKAARGGTTA
ncbi:hypothetical protein BSKO_08933 [Bryopsis sp. KO-2023]|nr:hypothetical protein BSKO_08933 [Bryopsis sp. KO-2023]